MASSNVRFKITIEKVEDVDYVSKEWRKMHDDEVYKTTIVPQMRAEGKSTEDMSQYAYVETDTTKQITTEIYKQTVTNEPDMMEVIKAFNKVQKD